MPQTLQFARKLCRHVKSPISEGAGIERSEMTGGVSHTLLPLCSFFFLSSPLQFVQL